MERLVTLKNIFAKQLPKMPKEYISRLVLDRRHVSLGPRAPRDATHAWSTLRRSRLLHPSQLRWVQCLDTCRQSLT